MALKLNRKSGLTGPEILEQAVHLLRKAPLNVLLLYYIGAAPFVLSFLYFWSDMSRSAFAESRGASAAFGVALLFLWMKTWQALFCSELRARVAGREPVRWTFRRFARTLSIQSAIQPSALFLLPTAFVIMLPFGWTYGFYQNATVIGAETDGIKNCFGKAVTQAQLWPKQNHILLAILGLFGFFVWLNVGIAIIQIPALLKMFLGIETVFTKSGVSSILNTTFFAASVAVTYLCLDPLIKAVYVLRCFYGDSIASGEDLKAQLRATSPQPEASRSKSSVGAVAVVIGVLVLASSQAGAAVESATPASVPVPVSNQKPAVSASDLSRSIDEVLNRREFTWRLPREKAPEIKNAQKNWFVLFIDGVLETFASWARTLRDWVRNVFEWLGKLFGNKGEHHDSKPTSIDGLMTTLQVLIFVLLALVAATVAILILRIWKQRKRTANVVVAQAVAAQPDIADENILADQLPEDGWLKMARELMEQGNLRLALRAFYLASLAHLAQREMISIAKFKSNRDYDVELRRRARALPDLQTAFSQNVGMFDRVWYGMHEVTEESLQGFRTNFERIRAC